MEDIKGYGFRPSDEELIGYLQDITFDRDSRVQYITQLEDICEFEPWELPGLSVLQPGSRVWYFIYSSKYKYQTGKLLKRDTREGYWKPTGKPRKVMDSVNKTEIGSKRSLVFHKGRPKGKKNNTQSDNKENKTKHGRCYSTNRAVWVMHEYKLNTATPPNQETIFLGKLMKKSEEDSISNNKGGSNHDSPSNSRNQVAKDLSNKPLEEVEASNDTGGVPNDTNEHDNHNQNEEIYPQERSNQHNFVDNNEVSNLTSGLGSDSAVAAISIDCVDTSGLLITAPQSPNGSAVVRNEYSTNDHGKQPWNNNSSYPEEGSNQHNIVAENVSSNLRAGFENDDEYYFYPMDLSDYDGVQNLCSINQLVSDGLFFHELLGVPKALDNNNSDRVQNQSSINQETADGFRNSNVINYETANPDERSNQHNIAAADIEGSNLPSFVENVSSSLRAGFENDDADLMDLSDCDLCNFEELLELMKTPDNLKSQSSTNEQDAETRNPWV
ncbi:hypothetical protein PTKIN_Ptkin17bG0028700 [Pterospermum kingtungense]